MQGAPAGKVRRKQLPWVCTVSVQIGRRQGESYCHIRKERTESGHNSLCTAYIHTARLSLIASFLAHSLRFSV